MGEYELMRLILQKAFKETKPQSERAEALVSWCKRYGAEIGLPKIKPKKKPGRSGRKNEPSGANHMSDWRAFRAVIVDYQVPGEDETPHALAIAGRLAELVRLPAAEGALLVLLVAAERFPRIKALFRSLRVDEGDTGRFATELVGLDFDELAARGPVRRLGLIHVRGRADENRWLVVANIVDRVIDSRPKSDDETLEAMVGVRVASSLALSQFAAYGREADLARRILAGAIQTNARGVNILLYGPPGTGKTELAKSLAAAAGASLFSVGESDGDDDEPNRWDRVTALKLAHRVLERCHNAALLFDEMEDLIGDVEVSRSGAFYAQRDGSKVFVNRLLETNPLPVLWTTNTIENIDAAVLRRMSFVIRMDIPSRQQRERIIDRIAREEGMPLSHTALAAVNGIAPETVTVARNAFYAARLAAGDEKDARSIASALVGGIRRGEHVARNDGSETPLDLDLYHCRQSMVDILDRFSEPGAPTDFSLLLYGPPGTGKTALAHHLARRLDRPLLVKRASDLLSSWVGESEKAIACSFSDAARQGAVLLFDEIESLLYDRMSAKHNWEVSQINELLTWMDHHPLPFVAATNFAERLDPAALRRFVFKIELQPLPLHKTAHAFRVFFGEDAPAEIADVTGLTPGDFAVIARQVRFERTRVSPADIVRRLAAEVAIKPQQAGPIGFRPSTRTG